MNQTDLFRNVLDSLERFDLQVDQEDIAHWANQLGLRDVWQAVLSKLQDRT